jgi:hypothetical protein
VGGGCGTSDAGFVSVSDLENAVIPCIGVPLGDATVYGEQRVFLESQGWWGERKTDGTVPKHGDAEHIHVGMCFPLQQTVSGIKTFRVRVLGHNLPVGSKIDKTHLHDPGGGGFPDITWNRTVLASDNGNVELWTTVQINTAGIPNGFREFRNQTVVIRPDLAELQASSGWCWTIANGSGTPVPSGSCPLAPSPTMARGWYECFEYKIAELRNWTYPYSGRARNTSYTFQIGARDGAGANTVVTGWEVRLDPDFHAGNKGNLIASGSGSVVGQSVTVPGSLMTGPTTHKLVVISFANSNCTSGGGLVPQNGELSAVFAVPIKVN